jgi:hypothetical protein
MFNPADPNNKAYWLPVPLDFLTATGAVVAQWGYFEANLNGFLQALSRHPDAAKLIDKKPPQRLKEKTRLLRQLARICFRDSQSLVEKVCCFSFRAKDLGDKRNAIAHGLWFDRAPFEPGTGVTLSTEADGTGDFYSVDQTQLEELAKKIAEIKLEGMLLMLPYPGKHFPYLERHELFALLEYHKNFPPTSPASPIPRDPNRKGSPQQPEPFRA